MLDQLSSAYGPAGPAYAFGALGLLLVLLAVPFLVDRRGDPLDKLGGGRNADRKSGAPAAKGAEAAQPLRYDQGGGSGLGDALAPLLQPKDAETVSSAKLMLVQAGYRSPSAVQTFYLARILGAAVLCAGALAYMLLKGGESTLMDYGMYCGGGFLIGYMAPNYWVSRRRQARQQEVGNGFPDALDMMLICVEAGQSLDQSLQRVAQEINHAHPALSEEFQIVALEMRAGKDRSNVLRDFAERAGVPDISSFVTVLIQSTQFGTSVAEALRVYAAEMRDKRLMRAEEKANKLPTKLTLGTMMFTVPPLMLILIGPSLIDIMEALTNMKK